MSQETGHRPPVAFAVLYRRHARRLLSGFAERTGDARAAAELCAETFAAALTGRFDPECGSAADRLDALAAAELSHFERTGAPRDRARRRLGIPPLDPPGDVERFVADLEEELVAAARFAAGRRAPRPLPRAPRAVVAGVAALALVAAAAALAASGGDGETAARERSAAAELPEAVRFRLPAMQPLARCADPARAAGTRRDIALLRREPRPGDTLPFAARRLPIGGFDGSAVRRAGSLHVVPSREVAPSGKCGAHAGPGLCLVARAREFRCFTAVEVEWGRAVARTSTGTLAGVVPDGVGSVMLSDDGAEASASVAGNVYEARAGFPAGEGIEVAFAAAGCRPAVAPQLLSRVALLLDRPRRGERLPGAAIAALDHAPVAEAARYRGGGRLDHQPVAEAARYWGGGDGVDFWAVPVARGCAAAERVCIVAVAGASAAAECGRGHGDPVGDRPAIFGTVPDGVTGVRVTQAGATTAISAHDNVYGGVLPSAYEAGDRIELLRGDDESGRLAGIVDAGGPVEDLVGRLRARGYLTLDEVTPAGTAQPYSIVYWWPGRAGFEDALELAAAAGVHAVEPIRDTDAVPPPVLEAHAPFVVVVGRR